jgi:hypothetical protein
MRIELLMFPGCPHVEAARAQLRRALREAQLPATWEERDISLPGTPADLASHGSPSILVDGRDVCADSTAEGLTCRVYRDSETSAAPALALIVSALRRS